MKPTLRHLFTACAAGLLLLAGCSTEKPVQKVEVKQEPAAPKPETAAPAEPAGKTVKVKLETSKGIVIIEVNPDWAPIGAQRFLDLVKDGYYTNARFFRVVPNFVVQFGLAAEPVMTKKWDKPIKDDPVIRTNALGTVTFATAGPNTRTAQIFISTRSNQMLDSQGFAPFGKVIEGMSVVEKLYAGYGENPDQEQITKRGNAYLSAQFPNLDYIRKATIL